MVTVTTANEPAESINARSPMHKIFDATDFEPQMIGQVAPDGSFNYTVFPVEEKQRDIQDVDEWIYNWCKERNIPKIGRIDKDGKVTPR